MTNLSLHDFPSQQPESSQSTPFIDRRRSEYLMLDLFGTVLEVRLMIPSEARETNLELEALDVPYHWAPLASIGSRRG
jgi:hypothetical protein